MPARADSPEAERGLGVLGESQLILVSRRQQVPQVDARRLRAAVAERGNLLVLEEPGPHAGLLRALAGVEECNPGRNYMPLRRLAAPTSPLAWGGVLLLCFDYFAARVVAAVAADR